MTSGSGGVTPGAQVRFLAWELLHAVRMAKKKKKTSFVIDLYSNVGVFEPSRGFFAVL